MSWFLDFIGIVGAALIVAGVSVMHWPTGMIVAGAMLLTTAILAAIRRGAMEVDE